MNAPLGNINIQVAEQLFLKDPESSELGKKIVSGSIQMMAEIGYEEFTFRKLALEIGSTEASIYRYFESKYKILLYLSNWFWSWMQYRLVFYLANIKSAEERLQRAIHLVTSEIEIDQNFIHINEVKLNQILISESVKVYLHKSVDQENNIGAFLPYKNFVNILSDIILEINPNYKFPKMLVSTLIEGSHLQQFFAVHLPRLTDIIEGENAVEQCYLDLILKTIKPCNGNK